MSETSPHPHRPGRPGRPRRVPAPGAAAAAAQPSADKALAILELFSEERPWLRVGDVAPRLGVSDSTASRLLTRLEARGFVERHPETGLYALGPRILTLAGVAMNHSDLRRAGLEEMHRLVHTLGLGANLAVLRDGGVFYLGNLDGRQAPRYYTLLGRRYPLHATALGKVLIAWRDPAEVALFLRASVGARSDSPDHTDGELQRYTRSTIADLPVLMDHLAAVRARGYATEVEELAMGRACVAAPIRGRSGAVIAGLSISGPVRVMNLQEREDELAAAAVDAAMHVSERLGFVMALLDAHTTAESLPDWQTEQALVGGSTAAPRAPEVQESGVEPVVQRSGERLGIHRKARSST